MAFKVRKTFESSFRNYDNKAAYTRNTDSQITEHIKNMLKRSSHPSMVSPSEFRELMNKSSLGAMANDPQTKGILDEAVENHAKRYNNRKVVQPINMNVGPGFSNVSVTHLENQLRQNLINKQMQQEVEEILSLNRTPSPNPTPNVNPEPTRVNNLVPHLENQFRQNLMNEHMQQDVSNILSPSKTPQLPSIQEEEQNGSSNFQSNLPPLPAYLPNSLPSPSPVDDALRSRALAELQLTLQQSRRQPEVKWDETSREAAKRKLAMSYPPCASMLRGYMR